MKFILSIMLIIVMGASNQKENTMPMIREDGRTERAAQRPPAWLGNRTNTGTGNGGFVGGDTNGGGNIAAPKVPWWQKVKDKLGELQPSSLGGNVPVPNFNTPQSITQGQQTYAQNNPIPNAVAAPTPGQFQTPAWMQTMADRVNTSPYLRPTSLGGNTPVPNFNTQQSIAQGQGQGDGNVYNNGEQGTTQQGTPTQGTNSFIGGGGDAVIGPNQGAYTPWMPITSTFLAANNMAARYGEAGAADAASSGGGGGSGGFGSSYGGNWRRGGGGRGGGSYGGGYNNYGDSPAWFNPYMNLYSWNYKG